MQSSPRKIIVGVLRGGPSEEYEVSLKSGASVIKHLSANEKYLVKDVFIDKNGVWHIDGIARNPDRALRGVDVAFNALHGAYGEDGRVQQILESHHVPYTGSNSLASAIGMNKILSKKYFKEHSVPIAEHIHFRKGEHEPHIIAEKLRETPHLQVVKPVTSGSSLGVTIVRDPADFPAALEKAFEHSDTVMVEEFVGGREATCGVLESSDGAEVYALPPVEIIAPAENSFFDYDAKYGGQTQEICPGNFTPEETRQIQEIAVKAHRALGMRHYSRTDIMVTPKGMFALEINSLPGLTSESLLPKALNAAGITYPEFLDHIITAAMR